MALRKFFNIDFFVNASKKPCKKKFSKKLREGGIKK